MVKPGRDRELEDGRHLGQVGPLAAEEVLELHRWAGVGVVEIEDVRHRASLPWHGEPQCVRRSLGGHIGGPLGAGIDSLPARSGLLIDPSGASFGTGPTR